MPDASNPTEPGSGTTAVVAVAVARATEVAPASGASAQSGARTCVGTGTGAGARPAGAVTICSGDERSAVGWVVTVSVERFRADCESGSASGSMSARVGRRPEPLVAYAAAESARTPPGPLRSTASMESSRRICLSNCEAVSSVPSFRSSFPALLRHPVISATTHTSGNGRSTALRRSFRVMRCLIRGRSRSVRAADVVTSEGTCRARIAHELDHVDACRTRPYRRCAGCWSKRRGRSRAQRPRRPPPCACGRSRSRSDVANGSRWSPSHAAWPASCLCCGATTSRTMRTGSVRERRPHHRVRREPRRTDARIELTASGAASAGVSLTQHARPTGITSTSWDRRRRPLFRTTQLRRDHRVPLTSANRRLSSTSRIARTIEKLLRQSPQQHVGA